MLYIYGAMLPARILEEIRFWKLQEMEHTEVIQAIIPTLEAPYVKLLNEWKVVFGETEKAADQLLQQVLTTSGPLSPQLIAHIEILLRVSLEQSKEFIRQLYIIKDNSPAAKQTPLADTVLLHIIRESEYFIEVLEHLGHSGEIQRLMTQPSHMTAALQASDSTPLTQQEEGDAVILHSVSSSYPNPQPVPIGGHRLPPLPYPYNALEPYIDEKTMRIHHDKHHQSYVDGLNKAEKKLEEARKTGDFDLVKHWERELAFNGAGHYLHTIFWNTMNPKGGGTPGGELAKQIHKDFGSFERFKKHFSEAADKVEGGGWAILVWSPRSHRLEILQAEKHQNLSQWDVVPILPLDVWEHAYYLKHQNNRKDYIKDWWNVVYWPEAEKRFEQARKLMWEPY
ncbi:Fe-Mn family superoxide dismutase [Paenibacillus dakarensis]|uniref:Fe-Mn family superoxide dismutase n=1 Tax=Paenibacillus dakarensis TaxID=1527293 RepID=UPI0006D5A95D|nr:Fe-Mn family superoxide dismutase [Paenibacillus dakarensis]